jgi:hypothetical protein
MADDGHVLRPIAGPEAREILAEDHVQHPVQAVFHPSERAPRVRSSEHRGRASTDNTRPTMVDRLSIWFRFARRRRSERQFLAGISTGAAGIGTSALERSGDGTGSAA